MKRDIFEEISINRKILEKKKFKFKRKILKIFLQKKRYREFYYKIKKIKNIIHKKFKNFQLNENF